MAFIVSGVSDHGAVAHAGSTPTSALMKAKELENDGYEDVQIEDPRRVFTPDEFRREFQA